MIACYKGNYYAIDTVDLTNTVNIEQKPAYEIAWDVYDFPTLHMAYGPHVSEKIQGQDKSAFASVILVTEGYEGDRHFDLAVYEFEVENEKLTGVFDVREYKEYDILRLESEDYTRQDKTFDEIALNDFFKVYSDIQSIL